jgi:hypothetical protein
MLLAHAGYARDVVLGQWCRIADPAIADYPLSEAAESPIRSKRCARMEYHHEKR